MAFSKYVLFGKNVVLGQSFSCILDREINLNVYSKFANKTLFHLYILLCIDMTYFVISVLSF